MSDSHSRPPSNGPEDPPRPESVAPTRPYPEAATSPQDAAVERDGEPVPWPASLARYRVVRLLGRGGMGTVYLAHDAQLDRPVAVKLSVAAGPGTPERFRREARAAARLAHPNLCPVYDSGEADGVLYLTMAYVEGEPLSAVLQRGGPWSERRAAELVAKIARALQEAHARGVVHRDVKPANVIITPRGEPVVTDFGLARRFADARDGRITREGALSGTPAYMPPEQVNGDDSAGPLADVYSLGVVLYELLTGRTPFAGPVGAILAGTVHEAPPPPSQFRPGLDPEIEAICLKALAKSPADRFPSMAEFAAALERFLDDDTEVIPAPTARPARRSRPVPERRTRWGWAITAGIGLALLVALVGLLLPRERDGRIAVELSDPSAPVEVTLDGRPVARQALADLRLKPGPHELAISGGGYEPLTQPFNVVRGENGPLRIALRPKPQPPKEPSPTDRARAIELTQRAAEVTNDRRFRDAITLCDEAIRLNPKYAPAYLVRGMAYGVLGDHERSIADLKQSIALDPNPPGAYINLAASSNDLGRYDDAIRYANEALARQPDSPRGYQHRGLAYAGKGDFKRALADLNETVRLRPESAEAHLDRSFIQAKLGNAEAARADREIAVGLKPRLADVEYALPGQRRPKTEPKDQQP